MFPLFSVSLGQCRQRISYLCNIKIFCHFQNFIWGHFANYKFLTNFPLPEMLWPMGSALRCALAFCNWRGIVLLWRGRGGEWSKGFFVLRKSFFQTEIHLLYSQLISCVPNTNVIIMSSSTSTTSLSPFYDPGLCDVWPVSREVYLQVEGRERDRSMRKRHFDKVRKLFIIYRQGVDLVQCINTTLTWQVWN